MNRLFLIVATLLISLWGSAQESFTLDEAINYALDNSNQTRLQELEIQNADHVIRETKAIGIPKVNGGLDYSYYFYVPKQPVQDFVGPAVYGILNQEGVINKPPPTPETFELSFVQPHQLNASIGANALIFDGTYLVGLEAARLYKDLARKQAEASKEQIVNNVTKAYTNILIAELNKGTLDKNIANLDRSLKEVNAMYEAGFVESLDVDRLQLSYDQLVTQSKNIDELLKLSYNLLKFQMNYDLNSDIEITEDLNTLIDRFSTESDLNSIVIDPEKRSQFKLLQMNQELNQLDMKRYKKGYLPSVVGFGNFQYSLQRSDLFDNNETGFLPTGLVGLKVNIPIYDGGEKAAKIQQVKVKMAKNDIQKEEFIKGMTLEVNNAMISILNAKRNVANKKNTLEMTENIYNKTQIKFREGVGSSVELTQAESSLYQAQSDYSNALYELLQAKIDLDIALGNLYE